MDKYNNTKKTLIYFAGNFSSKIFSLLIIPIYAIYLTAEDLGKFDFQLSIANLLSPIIGLAIWEGILRYGIKATKKEKKSIITTSFIISAIMFIFSFITILIGYNLIYGLNTVTFLYVLLIILTPVVTICGYIVRTLDKQIVFAASGIISSIINMIFIIIFLIIRNDGLVGLLLSSVISYLFNILFLFIRGKIYDFIQLEYFSYEMANKLLVFSLPLILNLFFGWFINSFSRFYINLNIGSTANGIYAFASKFSMILLQVAGIINMTMIEDAIQTMGNSNWIVRFEKNIDAILRLFFRVSYVLLPLIGLYYQTVNNQDFSYSLVLVPILMYATLLTNISTFIGNIFSVYNKTGKIFITTMVSGIVNIILAIILGSFMNLYGVIIAQLIGSFILFLFRYIYGTKINPYKINFFRFTSYSIIYIIISLLTISRIYFLQLGLVILLTIYNMIIYRDEIIHTYNSLKKIRGKSNDK